MCRQKSSLAPRPSQDCAAYVICDYHLVIIVLIIMEACSWLNEKGGWLNILGVLSSMTCSTVELNQAGLLNLLILLRSSK